MGECKKIVGIPGEGMQYSGDEWKGGWGDGEQGSVLWLTWLLDCIWNSKYTMYTIYRPKTRSSTPIGHAKRSKNIEKGGEGI
jgi:hypothetical protein